MCDKGVCEGSGMREGRAEGYGGRGEGLQRVRAFRREMGFDGSQHLLVFWVPCLLLWGERLRRSDK